MFFVIFWGRNCFLDDLLVLWPLVGLYFVRPSFGDVSLLILYRPDELRGITDESAAEVGTNQREYKAFPWFLA